MTSQIAPVTADALTKFYTAKSVAIIYDSTQNYTTSTSAAVKAKLEAAGGRSRRTNRSRRGRRAMPTCCSK